MGRRRDPSGLLEPGEVMIYSQSVETLYPYVTETKE